MMKILTAVALSAILLSSPTVFAMGQTDDGKVQFTTDKDVWGGQWDRVKGKFKEKFGKLIHDDEMIKQGDRDQITGLLQEKYGWTKVEADKKLNDFVKEHKMNTAGTAEEKSDALNKIDLSPESED